MFSRRSDDSLHVVHFHRYYRHILRSAPNWGISPRSSQFKLRILAPPRSAKARRADIQIIDLNRIRSVPFGFKPVIPLVLVKRTPLWIIGIIFIGSGDGPPNLHVAVLIKDAAVRRRISKSKPELAAHFKIMNHKR